MRRCAALAALLLLALAATAACGGGDEPERLVVIDLNILHGIGGGDESGPYERISERIELIAAALAEAQPDVVFLQEVLTGADDDYPDVRGVLLEALGDEYRTVFGDLTGNKIDADGLGQLTLTRLPVVSAANRSISMARSAHRVTVETVSGPIDLYNTHLEGAGAVVDVTAAEALAEIATLLAFIEESAGRPALLAGDFNARPQHGSIRALRDAGFVDAVAEGGDATCVAQGDPGCTSSTRPLSDNPENLASKRIDYVWVRDGGSRQVSVERAELFLNEPVALEGGGLLWPSDHIGVLAELRLE